MEQPAEKRVLQDIVNEIRELARQRKDLTERTEKVIDKLDDLLCRDKVGRKKLLGYLLVNGALGEPFFEDVEQIVEDESCREDGTSRSMGPEPKVLRRMPKSRECLRKINCGVVCPYAIDVRSNTITYVKNKDQCYQIPRGDASRVVNALVRGMLNGIRKKRPCLVRFTRKEEKILHRNGDSARFYRECVVRTELRGDGNQRYGETAHLRE